MIFELDILMRNAYMPMHVGICLKQNFASNDLLSISSLYEQKLYCSKVDFDSQPPPELSLLLVLDLPF